MKPLALLVALLALFADARLQLNEVWNGHYVKRDA